MSDALRSRLVRVTRETLKQFGTIYTFRDFRHLQAVCKVCAAMTTIELGVITGGCQHIHVVFCDDAPVSVSPNPEETK